MTREDLRHRRNNKAWRNICYRRKTDLASEDLRSRSLIEGSGPKDHHAFSLVQHNQRRIMYRSARPIHILQTLIGCRLVAGETREINGQKIHHVWKEEVSSIAMAAGWRAHSQVDTYGVNL